MTNTQKKKRKLRKLMSWRKKGNRGNFYCKDCGKKLTKTMHHFYCNKCWHERKGLKIKRKNKKVI